MVAQLNGLHLVTTLFRVRALPSALQLGAGVLTQAALTERESEYVSCLHSNLLSGAVAKVHTIVQCGGCVPRSGICSDPSVSLLRDIIALRHPALSVERRCLVKWVPTIFPRSPAQPLYSDLFDYCNRLLVGKVCMVVNADIYLSPRFPFPALHTLFVEDPKRVFALTRYEDDINLHRPLIDDYRGSHDAFIFLAPVDRQIIDACRHPQNAYRAENVVIHAFQRSAYRVSNPCLSLKIFHRHAADVRQWFPPTANSEAEYGTAVPCQLEK
jgi:hypothetical protein